MKNFGSPCIELLVMKKTTLKNGNKLEGFGSFSLMM